MYLLFLLCISIIISFVYIYAPWSIFTKLTAKVTNSGVSLLTLFHMVHSVSIGYVARDMGTRDFGSSGIRIDTGENTMAVALSIGPAGTRRLACSDRLSTKLYEAICVRKCIVS